VLPGKGVVFNNQTLDGSARPDPEWDAGNASSANLRTFGNGNVLLSYEPE